MARLAAMIVLLKILPTIKHERGSVNQIYSTFVVRNQEIKELINNIIIIL